jgi:hypothetical protein
MCGKFVDAWACMEISRPPLWRPFYSAKISPEIKLRYDALMDKLVRCRERPVPSGYAEKWWEMQSMLLRPLKDRAHRLRGDFRSSASTQTLKSYSCLDSQWSAVLRFEAFPRCEVQYYLPVLVLPRSPTSRCCSSHRSQANL